MSRLYDEGAIVHRQKGRAIDSHLVGQHIKVDFAVLSGDGGSVDTDVTIVVSVRGRISITGMWNGALVSPSDSQISRINLERIDGLVRLVVHER
jgi:hypothetical protein